MAKQKTFTLSLEYEGTPNSMLIVDYPSETYADIHNLDKSFTNEEYLNLPDDEWQKYAVIIPKHKVLKSVELNGEWILEIEIISERIKYSEIYFDSKLIKLLHYKTE